MELLLYNSMEIAPLVTINSSQVNINYIRIYLTALLLAGEFILLKDEKKRENKSSTVLKII